MNHRIHSALNLSNLALVAVLAAILGVASGASAQRDAADCRPGDLLCAEGHLGPIEGRIRIGPGGGTPPPPPPPPVVVVEPPVVYTPPPPVVVVAPPPVVYNPPPPVYVPREPVTIEVETRRTRRTTYELVPTFDMGFHLQGSGMFTDRIAMFGMGGAARIRPDPHFAIDIGLGAYYGIDYQNAERWEVPVTADLLFFFNPQHRFQIYALVGGGMSFAGTGSTERDGRFITSRDLFYLGGEAGLGAEIRLSRFFAINGDVRGFLRENVAGGRPEFTEVNDGLTRSTNTSMGVYGNIGMTFYFFGN
jgi:hypothetical protein